MNEGVKTGNGATTANGSPTQKRSIEDVSRQASAQIEHARVVFDNVNDRVISFIRERPGTALLGALAFGYIVGKLASRR